MAAFIGVRVNLNIVNWGKFRGHDTKLLENISHASGKSFLATAMEKISLVAHSMGIEPLCQRRKVEIQAQSAVPEVPGSCPVQRTS